jgi:hypothetical protein
MQKYRESLNRARPPMPAFPSTRFMSNAQVVNSILPFDAFGGPETETGALVARLKVVEPCNIAAGLATHEPVMTQILETLGEHELAICELQKSLGINK